MRGDLAEADRLALLDADLVLGLRQRFALLRLDLPLDGGDDLLRFPFPAVDQQPAWTLGDMPSYDENDQAEEHAQAEGEAPAHVLRQDVRVQRDDRQQRAADRADPEAAVDDEVDPAAVERRDELVDRGVDGRVLASDAEAGEEAEREEPPRREGHRGQRGGGQIDRQGDHEQLLAAEAVGHPAPEEGADAGAGDVQGGRDSGDLTGGDR
ncbi:hypothetical protein QFZ49_005255 [Streptomyces turgidiscabies]|uniref:Uncharacterized protein n=1 Tax=Streptomyces turgidiscabies TaxID=85558 RepID=A0ABU0RU14_9ACTN|nr:hypothetical protein [Streptomyces turgidiscabies]